MTRSTRPRLLCAALVSVALAGCAAEPPGPPAEPTEPTTSLLASTEPSVVPSAKAPRFRSIQAAVDYIQARLDVPVVVPHPLPSGTVLSTRPVIVYAHEGQMRAQLDLRFGPTGQITLQYGVAGFDGCGGDSAYPGRVGDQPAMINAHESRETPYTTVIWPATPENMQGRYGISATVPVDEALAMAESMESARASARSDTDPGC